MKRSAILLLAVLVAVLFTLSAAGQAGMATVKGTVIDEHGQPLADAQVEWFSAETGRRVRLKTNKKGEYFSLGVPFGTYRVTLTKDGRQLWLYDKVPVRPGEENVVDFDLAKEKARAAEQQPQVPVDPAQITEEQKAQLTEAQKKELERIQKEREKLKNLNDMLEQASIAQKGGDHAQAVQILEEASRMDPKQHVIWARLGAAQTEAKQFAPAVESYRRAIAIQPTAAYWNNMGQALAKAGKTEEALQAYNQAAQLEPTNAAMFYFNAGAVLTNAGQPDAANEAFDKAIAANPNYAAAHFRKGENLLQKATLQGDKMVAPPGTAEAFNKYLELEPNGAHAAEARAYLEALGAKVETEIGRPRRRR